MAAEVKSNKCVKKGVKEDKKGVEENMHGHQLLLSGNMRASNHIFAISSLYKNTITPNSIMMIGTIKNKAWLWV